MILKKEGAVASSFLNISRNFLSENDSSALIYQHQITRTQI
jgi:predicted small secreted protein